MLSDHSNVKLKKEKKKNIKTVASSLQRFGEKHRI